MKHAEPSAQRQSQTHAPTQSLVPAQLPLPLHQTAQAPPDAPHETPASQLPVPVQVTVQVPAVAQSTVEQAWVPEQSTVQVAAVSQKMPALQLLGPLHATVQLRASPQCTTPVQVVSPSQCTMQSKPAGQTGIEPSSSGSISQVSPVQPCVQASGQLAAPDSPAPPPRSAAPIPPLGFEAPAPPLADRSSPIA